MTNLWDIHGSRTTQGTPKTVPTPILNVAQGYAHHRLIACEPDPARENIRSGNRLHLETRKGDKHQFTVKRTEQTADGYLFIKGHVHHYNGLSQLKASIRMSNDGMLLLLVKVKQIERHEKQRQKLLSHRIR